ncbi:MAG: hypothetical protein WD036_11510 [Bauldia sp.]
MAMSGLIGFGRRIIPANWFALAMKATKDAERREALETIIRESERLRNLAKASGEGFLAYLLETVLHEARATLIGQGHAPPAHAPSAGARSSPSVVPLVPPNRPRKRR